MISWATVQRRGRKVGYEARINGRKVTGGGLAALVEERANDLEGEIKRAVAGVYCDIHRSRPTITLRAGGGYTIDACCDTATHRAQAALERL
jgi:hypothetical protein